VSFDTIIFLMNYYVFYDRTTVNVYAIFLYCYIFKHIPVPGSYSKPVYCVVKFKFKAATKWY